MCVCVHAENDDMSTNLMPTKSELLALSDSVAQLITTLVNKQHSVTRKLETLGISELIHTCRMPK